MEAKTSQKVIAFWIGEEEYALPISVLQSVERDLLMTRVPNSAPFIKGVVNLRGTITPVLDMRMLLGKEKEDYQDSQRILIVTLGDLFAGLLVDAADRLVEAEEEQFQPAENLDSSGLLSGLIHSDGRLLRLLDLGRVLGQEAAVSG